MAEYYPLLARAVAAQGNASKSAREGIYERARKALLAQLRAHEPPLPEEDIEREATSLEEAIARVEAEAGSARVEAEAAPPATPAEPEFKPAPMRPAVAPKAMSLAERAQARRASLTPPPAAAIRNGADPVSQEAAAAAAKPTPPASVKTSPADPRVEKPEESVSAAPLVIGQGAAHDDDHGRAPIIRAEAKPDALARGAGIPRSGVLWKFGRSRAGESGQPIVVPSPQGPASWPPGSDESQESESEGSAAAALREEPASRPAPTRPLAPLARTERRNPALIWALGSAAVVIVVGVAVLAFLLRDQPRTVENNANVAPVAQKAPGKIIDRIGVGPTRLSDQTPGAASPLAGGPAPAASGQGSAPASSSGALQSQSAAQAGAAAAPAPAPSTASTPAQQQASTGAEAVAPVAQRAALLVQAPTPSDAQAIATFVGSVVWRLDTISQGAGKPVALAVRADIDVPSAKFKASMLLEKNTDDSLPASHTIELRFMPQPGSIVGDVKQIDTPQMRKEESPAGDPLAGVTTAITSNYFLVGLAKGDPAQSHNLDLMRSAGWFDVPMLLANGKIAKITFEKGVAGQKALADAFASWSE